ncbi:MAG: NAD(+)/NADH kinase, partial [Thauera sp.]|nr:NAD(+)/NADH kinase [Thauera sp.]
MSTPFRTLALIGKYQSPDVAESVLSIARFLRDRGLAVLIEQGTASSIGGAHDFPVASYEHIGASADLAVVIGGDGTMLHTARRLIEHGVPLVGVNLGRLGFLTDIARCSATERLAEILDGAFTAEDRFMLDVEVLRGGARVFHTLALNDVVV